MLHIENFTLGESACSHIYIFLHKFLGWLEIIGNKNNFWDSEHFLFSSILPFKSFNVGIFQ